MKSPTKVFTCAACKRTPEFIVEGVTCHYLVCGRHLDYQLNYIRITSWEAVKALKTILNQDAISEHLRKLEEARK